MPDTRKSTSNLHIGQGGLEILKQWNNVEVFGVQVAEILHVTANSFDGAAPNRKAKAIHLTFKGRYYNNHEPKVHWLYDSASDRYVYQNWVNYDGLSRFLVHHRLGLISKMDPTKVAKSLAKNGLVHNENLALTQIQSYAAIESLVNGKTNLIQQAVGSQGVDHC